MTDLVGALGLAQSTVSKHLACLRNCRLDTVQAAAASVYFRAQPALPALLAAAGDLLAAIGNAVALCPERGGSPVTGPGSGQGAGSVGVRQHRLDDR